LSAKPLFSLWRRVFYEGKARFLLGEQAFYGNFLSENAKKPLELYFSLDKG
jgi:hypothetical protein